MRKPLVEEPRQLADRQAMAHRDREQADERLEARLERRPFDRDAADWIGAIADDHLHPVAAAARRQCAMV